MKFQNSSIHGFKVMLCIKKRDERTEGRTNNPEAICPSNFFEVRGIKNISIGQSCCYALVRVHKPRPRYRRGVQLLRS